MRRRDLLRGMLGGAAAAMLGISAKALVGPATEKLHTFSKATIGIDGPGALLRMSYDDARAWFVTP